MDQDTVLQLHAITGNVELSHGRVIRINFGTAVPSASLRSVGWGRLNGTFATREGFE
jgi:hypothetical protein